MNALVPVPYDPRYKGTPAAVALLLYACQIAGHNIPLNDGWRSYAEQKYYRDGYEAGLPGFNYASDPDDPNAQNNHLRGEAWDIANKADRAAMLAAGFTPDGSEWWHFNEPNWRTAPIIPTDDNTTTASTGATPITLQEDDMPKYFITQATDGGTIVFGGPGIIPMPVPNSTWQNVLTRYVNAVNTPDDAARGKALAGFTSAEWKLIRQASTNQAAYPDLDKFLTKAGWK